MTSRSVHVELHVQIRSDFRQAEDSEVKRQQAQVPLAEIGDAKGSPF